MTKTPKSRASTRLAYSLFGLTLLLMIAASLVPQWRLWGLGIFAHISVYLSAILILACIAIALLESRRTQKIAEDLEFAEKNSTSRFALVALAITILVGVAFYLLRGRTHFLGDGYQLIHDFAKDHPLIKGREYGESLAHLWMRDLLGAASLRTAELSYQVISIGAGIIFTVVSSIAAALLFTRLRDRVLFVLALLSGGYSLMFFGYAENYSLLCLSILLFTVIGLLITRNRLNRWFILAPLALTIFFHIVGAVFIPAAIYILCQGTFIENRLKRTTPTIRVVLATGILLAGLSLFGYLYAHDFYFRFAFVPIFSTPFSIPSYTMFSPAHIADVVNLLFVIVPGLLLVIPMIRQQPLRKLFESNSSRFLLAAALPALIAASVLDPKLGMARDWDLFSFPGIPLVALIFWPMLNPSSRGRSDAGIAILAITLGFVSLIPRAVVQAVPDEGVARFKDILSIDQVRCRTGYFVLGEYYRELGDTVATDSLKQVRLNQYPGELVVRRANDANDAGRYREADALARQSIQMDPNDWQGWLQLSKTYFRSGQNDSAFFAVQVADGLNPYNPVVQNQLALANLRLGNRAAAFRMWQDLLISDTTQYVVPFNLARMSQADGNVSDYQRFLTIAAHRPDVPPAILLEYASIAMKAGDLSNAAAACRLALSKGGDTTKVRELVQRNPQLESLLNLPEKQ